MADVNAIYDLIRKNEMNDWVGGSDPEAVGDACYGILRRYIKIAPDSRLLDFGCGIGRVLLSVLKHQPAIGSIKGFDIMPQVIQFCEKNIASAFPRATFDVIQGSNDHYDEFIRNAGGSSAQSREQILQQYGGKFSGAYAFSVFTHVEKADFRTLLDLLARVLQPGGELLITAFLLTPYSRAAIEKRECLFPFGETALEDEGKVFIGNPSDRLGFIAFDLSLVEQMVFDAGLVITHVEHGSWTGASFSASLQDVIVCRRPNIRTGEVQHVPTVARPPRSTGA
ncbi:MAG: class I SAM-dependent methyltransferase [Burkholderiales bacterium]|jgi:SAM-dependent methyltransferase|nr:class I SAM-dependent methyltransferase [Burkholderiales bacterium]